MGRVKRYKKLKACDPFSKQFNRREVDTNHDEPPNVFEAKAQRHAKKAARFENNEMYQMRKIFKLNGLEMPSSGKDDMKKIEGKRNDESMKSFKKRLRQETRETLRDEIKGLTSTAKKRKIRLRDRKQQRKKGSKQSHSSEVFEREFSSSETGQLRPSDMDGAKIDFDAPDTNRIKFGERVEAPPDLRFTFAMSGAKKIGLGKGLSEGNTAGKRFAEMQQKRRKILQLSDSDDRIRKEGTLYNPGQVATVEEVEDTRNKVIAAYKELQKSRRKTTSN